MNQSSPYEILNRCIHCGMCLPVCPTYALTGLEISSPRGRIRLMKSVAEDKLAITETFVDEMYFCLDCQACQTVCPAGVQYGVLVENARRLISEEHKDPVMLRMVKRFLLNGLLASKRRLRMAARALWLYEFLGLRDAVERSGILSVFSESLDQKHSMLPRASRRTFEEEVPEILKPAGGRVRGRIGFLSGCMMNVGLADVHRDAVEVLLACGFEVLVPKGQECCGSLHAHNGEVKMARSLARRNLDVFEKLSFDYFVVDSGGCSAFLKEYGGLLADDPKYAEKAAVFSGKVRDITEFLASTELPGLREYKKRVTYHEACHLVHSQKISAEPRKVIRSVPGVDFVDLPESTWCCGSAGIYNITRFDDSMKLLERKMRNIASTGAEIVATANPGCHLQLQYGIRKFGLAIEVVHPVSLIRRAIRS